jgi:dUTPase
VRIKRLAGSQDIPLPIRMSEHASGFDLPAAVPQAIVVQPNQIALVPCGFAIALPPGYEAQIRPRSHLQVMARTRRRPLNHPYPVNRADARRLEPLRANPPNSTRSTS